MIVYPVIEIQNGRCVTLRRGRTEEPMTWHVDPVEKAREFASDGASWMHVTDLDAVAGDHKNEPLLTEILRHSGIPVQLAGGFRSLERVEQWVDLGAGRIVMGTLAIINPGLVKRIIKRFPDQIVISVDVWRGRVMTYGWKEPCAIRPQDLLAEFVGEPLSAFIVTDIDANIENVENSLELLNSLAAVSQTPVIASGIVRTVDDIRRAAQVSNVSGVLVGTALFNRQVELIDALAAAQQG